MAIAVIMPRQGQSVESCIISKWHKKKGDTVQAGDILFSYETDKASFEEASKVDGTLLDTYFEEGDDVPCLVNVCVIGNPGEDTTEFNTAMHGDESQGSSVPDNHRNETGSDETPAATAPAGVIDGRLKISPRAVKLAAREGVDPRFASPTGPSGRIIERDIIALRATGQTLTPSARPQFMGLSTEQPIQGTGIGGRITTADVSAVKTQIVRTPESLNESETEEVKLTNIRKVIAKAMHQSLSSTAQLTLNSSFDTTDILAYRKKLKESKEGLGLENITINDIILYAVSRTLPRHRELNAHLLDDRMLLFRNVHIGLAVDTERGLMVPTIFNSDKKSLNEISQASKQLVKMCQSGTVNPDMLKGGSFTVTNLGTLGIESFTPVLNPPQTGILGVNAIVQRAREVDGAYGFYPAMGLSLTFDHRAIDGAPAARFLQDLKGFLENFSLMLAI